VDHEAQAWSGPEHPKGRDQHSGGCPTARDHSREIEDWKEKFLLGAENALRSRPKDEEALQEEQIKKLKQKIGDLVMDMDILREAAKRHPPTPGTSDS